MSSNVASVAIAGAFFVVAAFACGGAEDRVTDSAAATETSSTSAEASTSTESGVWTSSGSSASGSSTTAASSATGSTSGGTPSCPIDDHFMCNEVPWDCSAVDEWSAFHCGAPTSWFDEQGCLREACDADMPCAAGFECFAPNEVCGVCFGPRPVCDEIEGASGVGCGCGNDGACGGQVCVPAELLVGDPCPGAGTSTGSGSG